MKKNKLFILLYLFLIAGLTKNITAQTYSNSWINYSQSYYRFKIYEDGIYRITYGNMLAAGIPVASVAPERFQIFGRGQEIYIHVHNQSTGVWSSGDYIEFYAQKNDGWYDSALYRFPEYQPDREYSLFTDTATYYLTWNNSFNNKRLSLENDNNYQAYTAAPYVIKDLYKSYNSKYIDGVPLITNNNGTVYDPEYAQGEGFYDFPFYLGGSRTLSVSTKNAYSNGQQAEVSFVLMGASNYSGANPDHHVRIQFAGQTMDTIFEGYKMLKISKNIAASALGSNNTSFTFSSINDLGSGADRNAVSYIEIKYPHTTAFENSDFFEFDVPDATQAKTYLEISNFNGGNSPLLYDIDNHKRILVTKSGSIYKTLIPNSGSVKHCVLVGQSKIHNGISLEPVGFNAQFKDYITQYPNADYIIITHKSLTASSSSFYNVDDYAAYRNSTGYNVMVVDIDDLYDQYSYGIAKNPMAIRNFMKRAIGELNNIPKNLFIIGKAYYPDVYRKTAQYFNETLVPSFGSPPSDVLLTAHILDTTYRQAVPTGRLAAKNLDHLDLYLNKVMQYEDPNLNPPAEWKKKALFFSGGDKLSLQNTIKNYMKAYQKIYEDTSYGGTVRTFYKTSTDPIQINLAAQIKGLINSGVNMLNFFGHAAGIGFDISIDNPSEYSNYGKYPFLIANSCFAGDLYQPNVGTVSSSEAFILIRDKGAIAYLGSVTTGSTGYLNIYTKEIFKNYCRKSYGKSIGFITKNTVQNVFTTINHNLYMGVKEVSLEMTLHGDPALILNAYEKPDYEVSPPAVYTDPEIVTTEKDSFLLNVVVTNLGKAVNDSIVVEIVRTLPDLKTKQKKTLLIKGPNYKDTLQLWFGINSMDDVGKNIISVSVDANSNVDELNENNNFVSILVDIKAADLKPVYPPEFAIVPDNHITLKASTFYALSPKKDYVFQIDTSAYFNSPLLESSVISSKGGVVEYTVLQALIDSAVYYWRVSIDSVAGGHYNWRNSSFQYISGERGWSQADFFQFENNTYRLALFNKPQRRFDFVNDITVLKCINGIWPYIAWNMPQYQLNGIQMAYAECVDNGLKFAVIDPISGKPWYSHNNGNNIGPYGNYHCKSYDYASFEFPTNDFIGIKDTVWYRRAADFVAQIPDGYMVLMRTARHVYPSQFPEYLYKAIDSLGANYIRSMPDDRPYILWGVKGDLGNATEIIGDSLQANITLVDSFKTRWKEGYIASPVIGPTSKWYALGWHVHSQDSINTDSVRLALIGIEPDGTMDTVFRDLTPDSTFVSKLNDKMPASDYPYCKLVCFMKDDSLHTPAYIDRWQIFYKEVPELAIAPKQKFLFHADTLLRGDSLKISIAYRNISKTDLGDSLLVRYWIVDSYKQRRDLGFKRLPKINAQSYLVDSLIQETKSLTGNCSFFIDINTINPATNFFDQAELTHINNNIEIPFFVKEDDSPPVLDVTFDGIHILDGDIVSAKPEITISLSDDNKFIALDDTNSFKVYLSVPGNAARKRIYFYKNGEEQLQFIPAELPKNKARVVYKPVFDKDGEYTLYVQALDPSLNLSGVNDYQIKFNVVNKSTITSLLNWPNPFTTKTHFVFTLTGSQVPDYFMIQIMTISGKVVKEIDMSELGNIHVGRNITDYTWDGTDEYGDRLANGIYLYRVITKINGESIEHRNSGADDFITKEFGKMYLMR